jgi:hypothetical protein
MPAAPRLSKASGGERPDWTRAGTCCWRSPGTATAGEPVSAGRPRSRGACPTVRLPLTEVAALLGTVPPSAFITVIADTCYAAALSRFAFAATVVLLAACGADQEILAYPATGFAARLEQLVLAGGQPNPACTSYLWLNRQFRRDSPDVERPLVWTNRPFVWSQRPFRPISGPSCPPRPAPAGAVLARPGVP